jgi:hypothetical protein
MRIPKQLEPTHWIYLLIHVVLIVSGYALYASALDLWWKGVGTSITAAGVTGLVVFVYVLLSQETAKRLRTISELGLQTGFAGRGARIREEYQVRLESLQDNLDVNIFRIDDEVFWGPYLIHQQSRNSPTLLVRRGGLLFDVLLRHFETIWLEDSLSRPVPAEWLT